jgi:hypothetical protein
MDTPTTQILASLEDGISVLRDFQAIQPNTQVQRDPTSLHTRFIVVGYLSSLDARDVAWPL